MSQPSLTKQEPPRSRPDPVAIVLIAVVVIGSLVLVFGVCAAVVYHARHASDHQTQLEQQADQSDLQVFNVQVCGTTDSQILTSDGVVNADAAKFPVKQWGAYEFAVDMDSNSLVLYGPANPADSVDRC